MSKYSVRLPTGREITVDLPATMHVTPTRSVTQAEAEIARHIARWVEPHLRPTLPMRVIERDAQDRPARSVEVPALTAAQQATLVGNAVSRRIFEEARDE